MTLITFLLALALVARGTRLLTTDTITDPVRGKLQAYVLPYIHGVYNQETGQIEEKQKTLRSRVGHFVHKMLDCDWCTSVWVAAAVYPAAVHWGESDGFLAVSFIAALSFAGTSAITVHDAFDRHNSY